MNWTFDEFKKGGFSVFFSDEDYKARVRFLKKCKTNGINWGPNVQMDDDGISAAGMPDNADVILSVCQPQGWIVWGDSCENTLMSGRIIIPYYKMEQMKCNEVVGTLYRDGDILFESKEKEDAFTADAESCKELRECCERITSAARQLKEENKETSSFYYNGRLRCVKSFCSSFLNQVIFMTALMAEL